MVYIIIEWLSIFVDYAKYGFSGIPDILKKMAMLYNSIDFWIGLNNM